MNRGWARTLAFASFLPLCASAGCDALTVRSFAGTVMQFTFTQAVKQTSIPAGSHLELWARTQYDDIVRVPGYYDLGQGLSANGIMIRQAISVTDSCMLDSYYAPTDANKTAGHSLTTAAAFPTTTNNAGITQTPDQQAQQVVDRINQVTSNPTIQTGGPLLAVLPYDPNVPPVVPDTATPEERKAQCDAFIAQGANTYIANPYQLTAPLHGFVYGTVQFLSALPPADYDGFRIDTPLDLKNVQEIFFTVETDSVDPLHRGPLFLISKKTLVGNDVIHFNLVPASANITASGTAALETDLDTDPVQF
jgi:hypothetical protein